MFTFPQTPATGQAAWDPVPSVRPSSSRAKATRNFLLFVNVGDLFTPQRFLDPASPFPGPRGAHTNCNGQKFCQVPFDPKLRRFSLATMMMMLELGREFSDHFGHRIHLVVMAIDSPASLVPFPHSTLMLSSLGGKWR